MLRTFFTAPAVALLVAAAPPLGPTSGPGKLPTKKASPPAGVKLPPVQPTDYYAFGTDGGEDVGPYTAESSLLLVNPSLTGRLVSKGGDHWWKDGAKKTLSKILVDDHRRMIGTFTAGRDYVSLALDFDGNRTVDLFLLGSKDSNIVIMSEAARNNAQFRLYNPFCSVERGGERVASTLKGVAKMDCESFGAGSGAPPGASAGSGNAKPGYAPPQILRTLCTAALAGAPGGDLGRVTTGPGEAVGRWVLQAVLKAIGTALGNKFKGVLEGDGRGSGSFLDPRQTGSYPCESAGGGACQHGANDPANPAGSSPIPGPGGGGGSEGKLAEGFCKQMQKSYNKWWAGFRKSSAVKTNCLDPVTRANGSRIVDIDCATKPEGDNDPNSRLDDVLAHMRDGCGKSPVSSPKPGGGIGEDTCVKHPGTPSKEKLWYGYGGVIAAEHGITQCPPEVCRD